MDYFLYLVVVDLTAILEDWLGASVTLFLCNFHSLFLMLCVHASNSRFFSPRIAEKTRVLFSLVSKRMLFYLALRLE